MFRPVLPFVLLLSPILAFADAPSFEITIQDHHFVPSEVVIPKDTKVMLVIINQDATPEEFESHSLHREKVIPGHSRAVIRIGPLSPGVYEFFGEFHQDQAHGSVVVK